MWKENTKDLWKSLCVWVLQPFFSKALILWKARTKRKKDGEDIRNEKIQRNQTQREDKRKR